MTDKPTPTDAEIVQLSLEWPAETNDWASHLISQQ